MALSFLSLFVSVELKTGDMPDFLYLSILEDI